MIHMRDVAKEHKQLDAVGLSSSNVTLALIHVLRELFGLMQYWAYNIIQLKEKKSRQIGFEDQGQLDNPVIEIANKF